MKSHIFWNIFSQFDKNQVNTKEKHQETIEIFSLEYQ